MAPFLMAAALWLLLLVCLVSFGFVLGVFIFLLVCAALVWGLRQFADLVAPK